MKPEIRVNLEGDVYRQRDLAFHAFTIAFIARTPKGLVPVDEDSLQAIDFLSRLYSSIHFGEIDNRQRLEAAISVALAQKELDGSKHISEDVMKRSRDIRNTFTERRQQVETKHYDPKKIATLSNVTWGEDPLPEPISAGVISYTGEDTL